MACSCYLQPDQELLVVKQAVCTVDYLCGDSAHLDSSDFLQGLLNKTPKARLSWPDLLRHPFVRESPEEEQRRAAARADQVLCLHVSQPRVSTSHLSMHLRLHLHNELVHDSANVSHLKPLQSCPTVQQCVGPPAGF